MGFTNSNHLFLHGENGITFSLFTELDDAKKIYNFLNNVKWNKKPKVLAANNLTKNDFEVHLFPSFGKKYGAGEPDAIIIYGNFIFLIEVETKPIKKLSNHFFKQLNNFNMIGENVIHSTQKKVVGKPISITKKQRVYGKYRTRKLFEKLLNIQNPKDYYIVITNNHIKESPYAIDSLTELNIQINKYLPNSKILNKLGWIGFHSINRLQANNKTKGVIQFNLKD